MTDAVLLRDIELAAKRIANVVRLSESESLKTLGMLGRMYVSDTRRVWWWESLRVPIRRIAYGESDGLSQLEVLFAPYQVAILFVSDDKSPPWDAYRAPVKSIVELLRECRYFEYLLASETGEWIVFDTHMNELVVAGEYLVANIRSSATQAESNTEEP